MQLLSRRRSFAVLGSCSAAMLAAPLHAQTQEEPALAARFASAHWQGLSIRYPPSLLRVEGPAGSSLESPYAPERLVSRSGDFEVLLSADDVALGSAAERIRIDLDADADAYASQQITYRADGATWEVASGRIDGRVFYDKAVEHCPPAGCDVPIVSSVKFRYPVHRKPVYDRLLERMVATFTPAAGRLA